jgi:hypothetical protein
MNWKMTWSAPIWIQLSLEEQLGRPYSFWVDRLRKTSCTSLTGNITPKSQTSKSYLPNPDIWIISAAR